MDQLVLVGTVSVFSQSIVTVLAGTSGESGNAVLGKSLVVDNADLLRPVIRMVNETYWFFITHDRQLESLRRQRLTCEWNLITPTQRSVGCKRR